KRGFSARGLVAVLLADDEHRRFAVADEVGALRSCGPCEDYERNGATLLRTAEYDKTSVARPRGAACDERDHFVLAREVFAAGPERRRRNVDSGVGKACGDRC